MSRNAWYPPGSASATSLDANQGTPNTLANGWPVKVTDGVDLMLVNADGSINVTAAALPLPSGAATAARQDTGNTSLASIDTKLTSPLTVTGPLTDTQLRAVAVPVSGPLTDAQLRASAVPVSLASAPLPTGAATAANQVTEIASLASIDSKLANPMPVTGTFWQATQPISTVSLPLPSGASTSALQTTLNTKSASAFINNPFDETVITYVGATTDISTVVYKLASVTVNTLTMSYDGSNRLTGVVKT